jgi:hypothetical protein
MDPLPSLPKGHVWRQMPVSGALIYISFRVPKNRAHSAVSPHIDPIDGDARFSESSFICLSKFLVKEHPSRFP